MLIETMTRQASIALLDRTRLARLAYVRDGQTHIVPMSFAYDAECLYRFSTLGEKIVSMRANPRVCVEADELINVEKWETAIVQGRYEELPDTPRYDADRRHAHTLPQRRPVWWEPGYVKTIIDGKERPLELLYFRVHIDRISGRRGVP